MSTFNITLALDILSTVVDNDIEPVAEYPATINRDIESRTPYVCDYIRHRNITELAQIDIIELIMIRRSYGDRKLTNYERQYLMNIFIGATVIDPATYLNISIDLLHYITKVPSSDTNIDRYYIAYVLRTMSRLSLYNQSKISIRMVNRVMLGCFYAFLNMELDIYMRMREYSNLIGLSVKDLSILYRTLVILLDYQLMTASDDVIELAELLKNIDSNHDSLKYETMNLSPDTHSGMYDDTNQKDNNCHKDVTLIK